MNTNQSNNPLNIHSINQTNNIVIKKPLFNRFIESYINDPNIIFVNNLHQTTNTEFYNSYTKFSNNDDDEMTKGIFNRFCNKNVKFIKKKQGSTDRKRYIYINRELALAYK